MNIDFSVAHCQTHSSKKKFGLCDNPHPAKDPAYIAESDGSKWIAVVVNENRYEVTFTAVDQCIEIHEIRDEKLKQTKRCDGILTYDTTIIFVELKERSQKGNGWVEDAERQLKTSIQYFDNGTNLEKYKLKMAYIANSGHPKFKSSQTGRMQRFFESTGYVLRVEARIIL